MKEELCPSGRFRVEAECQLPAGEAAGSLSGGGFPWQQGARARRSSLFRVGCFAGGMDGLGRKRLLPGLAGDVDRGFICMGNGQKDPLCPGLFNQVIQNVFGNRPVGLLEALKEYILRGSAGWC